LQSPATNVPQTIWLRDGKSSFSFFLHHVPRYRLFRRSSHGDARMPLLKRKKMDLALLLVGFRTYLQDAYPQVNINKILTASGVDITSGSHVNLRQFISFCQHLVRQTGNEQIIREAGRATGQLAALGLKRQLSLGLGGPRGMLKSMIREQSAFWSADWKVTGTGDRSLDVTITSTGKETAFVCQHRSGFFESLALLFNQQSPGLAHPECSFRGDRHCRYILTWEPSPADTWRLVRNSLGIATGVSLLTLPWLPVAAAIALPSSGLAGMLAMTAIGGTLERSGLRRHLQTQQTTTEILIDQSNASLLNLQLTREIGQAISSRSDSSDLLQSVSDILSQQLDFDRGMILLADSPRKALHYRSGFGFDDSELGLLSKPLQLNNDHASTPLAPLLETAGGILINDIRQFQDVRYHNLCRWFARLGSRAFACCPIISDNQMIGLLALDLRSTNRLLVPSDLQLIEGVAPLIGIGLQNSRLLSERSAQFQSIIQVLAASIDARDFLTAGHSEQVTEYAVGICRQLELSADYTDMVRIAAMLHDYGKLGIPDFILKKDGDLTAEERALIHTHPDKSREILERIPFEGIYQQIPEIVGAHHEKLDGSGYPKGLSGAQVPLGARIIAVADFFEAITSKRHYRDPMPYPEALQLLAEESLLHFDKQVVEAFLCHLNENKVCLVDTDRSNPFTAERRKVRVPCRTQVSCQAGNRTVSGTSANLSSGGIFIATDNTLETDNIVDIIFALPDSPSKLFKLQGRVAWNNQNTDGLPDGFGLEFLELPDETAGALNNFISRAVSRQEASSQDPVLTIH
jgi:uncharacterized protein (TIGR02266 family)